MQIVEHAHGIWRVLPQPGDSPANKARLIEMIERCKSFKKISNHEYQISVDDLPALRLAMRECFPEDLMLELL